MSQPQLNNNIYNFNLLKIITICRGMLLTLPRDSHISFHSAIRFRRPDQSTRSTTSKAEGAYLWRLQPSVLAGAQILDGR